MKTNMKFKLKVIDKMIAEKEGVLEDYNNNQRNKLNQTTKDDIDNTQYDSQSEEALQEMDMLNNNVEILEKEIYEIRNIPLDLEMDKVRFGSLVETDKVTMLVGAAHENMDVDGILVTGISISAPIYEQMENLKQGDHFKVSGTEYTIQHIV